MMRFRSSIAIMTFGLLMATGEPPKASEDKTMDTPPPMADRGPPPDVNPVTKGGVRYATKIGGASDPQVGGLIAAFDVKTGRELWVLPVYDNRRESGLEGDVQDVFIAAMTLGRDGKLLVTDEDGRRYVVDVEKRTSTPAP